MFTKYKHQRSVHQYKKTIDWDAVAGVIILGIIVLAVLSNL